jgi:hypothetical protein
MANMLDPQIDIDVVLDVAPDAVGAEILLMNPIRKYKLENFRNINGKGHGTVRMPLDDAATLKFAPPQEAPTFAVPKSYPPYSVASAVQIVYKSTPASLTQFGADVIHMQPSGFPGTPESTENYTLPMTYAPQTTEKE